MLIQILQRTPSWVFILFLALLALGYHQSKGRTVSRAKVSMLPVAMILLSFYGVLSAFGTVPVGIVCWVVGVTIAIRFGVEHAAPEGVNFCAETKSYYVPGSWLPLVFMMGIFFTKYAVGIILARQLPIAGEAAFVGSVSICYGLFSGVFFARAVAIWRSARQHEGDHL